MVRNATKIIQINQKKGPKCTKKAPNKAEKCPKRGPLDTKHVTVPRLPRDNMAGICDASSGASNSISAFLANQTECDCINILPFK